MFLLFRHKNWKPHEFHNMSYGEKTVVRAFWNKESEEIKREMKEAELDLKGSE